MPEITKTLMVANAIEWREWLENNYNIEDEIWLIHYKKHSGKCGFTYDEAVEEALCFGWIDGIMKRIDDEKHTIRYTPRRKRSVWSELNKKRVKKLIKEGKITEAGMKKIREAKESGEWEKALLREDVSKIPDDLKNALKENIIAKDKFENYSPSIKKQFIWWINDAKKEETRQRRILKVIKMIEENIKPGMM
ncbi:YdeI family protein [Bacteroidota bacterium]